MAEVRQIPLTELMANYRPGSYGDDWTWDDEFAELAIKLPRLMSDIARNGVREPVLLGDDGRVWDGHHRICAAHALGLEMVPALSVPGRQVIV